MKLATTLVLALALAACGSKSSAPATTATPKKLAPLPADLAWKDMNQDQRHQYMEETVLPRTKEIFVAFDPSYSNMNCATCHGNGAEDGSYEMPDSKLKPLPNTPEAFMAWVQKDERAAKYAQFMAQKLVPLMGELLEKSVFDPKTGTGEFSCTGCHYLVDASGKAAPAPKREGEEHEHEHHHDGDDKK